MNPLETELLNQHNQIFKVQVLEHVVESLEEENLSDSRENLVNVKPRSYLSNCYKPGYKTHLKNPAQEVDRNFQKTSRKRE